MASRHDLQIEQGSSFSENYAWFLDGERQSLDGWTARAQIRTGPEGALLLDLDDHFSLVEDATVTHPTTGEPSTGHALRLMIPASATRTLVRSGMWDFFIDQADTDVSVRMLWGKVELQKAISL